MVVLVTTEETVVVVEGLHPGVEYTFTVVAVNDIGDSQDSDPVMATTLEESNVSNFLKRIIYTHFIPQFQLGHHR